MPTPPHPAAASPSARPARPEPGEGALPGQVRGVSGQGQQEPTAAQRPRGPVGPAATPYRGPPAARPDSRARPRPARRSCRLPARAAPGGGAAPPAARPHSSAARPSPPLPGPPPAPRCPRTPAEPPPAARTGTPAWDPGRPLGPDCRGPASPGSHRFAEGSRALSLTLDPRPGSRGDSEVPASR